jgi:glutathione-regulated potassium-efflux system protein KefB
MSLGGEFAFIVFNEAVKANLLDDPTRDRLIAAVGVSMALTPLLMIAAQRMLDATPAPKDKRPYDEIPDHHPQVLIAGMGRFGQIIARLLVAHRTPFIGIENSAEQVDFMRRFGNMIYYGDPARPELLRSAGAANVKIFVVAIDDRDSGIRTVRTIRRLYPKAKVFARARDRRHAWDLMDLGAEPMRETFHSSLKLGEEVLVELGVEAETARDHVERFRELDERMLNAQYLVHDDEDALIQSARDGRKELEELFNADRGEGILAGMVDQQSTTLPGDSVTRH